MLLRDKDGLRVDLGCGRKPPAGWLGVDWQPGPEVGLVWDLDHFPWPWADGAVAALRASHLVEHVDPVRGHFLRWMDEAWRVLAPGGPFLILTPVPGTEDYWGDPTHCNPCSARTWAYFVPDHPAHGAALYQIYTPRPWGLQRCQQRGEELCVVLEKRGAPLEGTADA